MNLYSYIPLILIFCAAYYSLVQLGLLVGLFRLPSPTNRSQPRVSVIVAARNEEHRMEWVLDALWRQTYPEVEVIIVDDRSTDRTVEIVKAHQQSAQNVHLVNIKHVPAGFPAKKNALNEGIRASTGEILFFTDADCLPPPDWISTVVAFFEDPVGVVAGYSPYDSALLPSESRIGFWRSLLQRFVAGEELKGAVWSAGSIGLNLAWLCTGRNLAYRRKVFGEVGGFERIKMSISGDDDLFIQLVRRATRWKIRYALNPESHVPTPPPETFPEFVQQRTRHFSAGKFFTLPMKTFFFLFHVSNLLLLIGFIGCFFSRELALSGVLAFLAKIVFDFLLTLTAVRRFGLTGSRGTSLIGGFLLTEILYIFYNTFIGPLGFIRKFDWKPDRTKS